LAAATEIIPTLNSIPPQLPSKTHAQVGRIVELFKGLPHPAGNAEVFCTVQTLATV